MNTSERLQHLHEIARTYVIDGLGGKNFDAIPYHDDITLRAPLNPGGSVVPIEGKVNVREQWWAPLPDLVGQVTVFDSYVNRDLSGVTVEFHCEIINPACMLRILDRFKVDADGKITHQENFFDPRGVTNPGG